MLWGVGAAASFGLIKVNVVELAIGYSMAWDFGLNIIFMGLHVQLKGLGFGGSGLGNSSLLVASAVPRVEGFNGSPLYKAAIWAVFCSCFGFGWIPSKVCDSPALTP